MDDLEQYAIELSAQWILISYTSFELRKRKGKNIQRRNHPSSQKGQNILFKAKDKMYTNHTNPGFTSDTE